MARISIRVKILVSVGLIIFTVLGISNYSNIRLLERDYLESIEWNSETLAQILAHEIVEMYTYIPNMQEMLEGLTVRCMELHREHEDNNIRYIAVINAAGAVAAHSNSELLGKPLADDVLDQKQFRDKEQFMVLDRGIYRTFVPVFGTQENVYIGSVEVGVPRQIVDEKIGRVISQAGRLLILFVSFAFLALSFFVHVLITKPTRKLVAISKRLASGQIEAVPRHKIERKTAAHTASPRDEIQVLTAVFYEMVEYLQEKADIAERISSGDIRQKVFPRSENDLLGNAFRRMTEYLQGMAAAADTIAKGDLGTRVQAQGEHDILGRSFRQMLAFLRQVANVAESISEGDLQVEVSASSEKDILNHSLQKMVTYLRNVAGIAREIAQNNLDLVIEPTSDRDMLNSSLQQMLENLQAAAGQVKRSMAEIEQQNWFRTGQVELSDLMRGEQDAKTLANNIVTYIAKYLQAQTGVLYLPENRNGEILLGATGTYASSAPKGQCRQFAIGEGIVGQAALSGKPLAIESSPQDEFAILCGLGKAVPQSILVTPLLYNGEVRGVLELGTAYRFTEQHREFLALVQEKIAVTFHSVQARIQMQQLLTSSQEQAEILGRQERDLRQAYQHLEEQTNALKLSEEKLHLQQEELRQTNEALSGQAHILAQQKTELEAKNLELETARQLVEEKMRQLEVSERYKSDFLANMSHELRTPLNSLLILAKLLHENTEGTLSPKQIDYARTIYESGTELLELLTEVLDLSKVETGKMLLNIEEVALHRLAGYISQHFAHVAEQKGISLTVDVAGDLPPFIHTDRQRLEQIMKNLLSNALKFTERGEIHVTIQRPPVTTQFRWGELDPRQTIAFAVSDTGIGIPESKQQLIFEAFQQLDGTVSRKYGGTGLGLSISRELTRLLGGEIHVESEAGRGSTFTLYLPERCPLGRAGERTEVGPEEYVPSGEPQETPVIENIRDDRHEIVSSDVSLLIVESDLERAKMIFSQVRERGFRALVAGDGEAGLQLAYQYKPQGIVLNLALPRMDGQAVIEKLRRNPETRHIPLHLLKPSAKGFSLERVQDELTLFLHEIESGAPGARQRRKLPDHDRERIFKGKTVLLADDDIRNSYALRSVLEEHAMGVVLAGNGQEALSILEEHQEIDLVLMDIMMPVMDGYEAIRTIREQAKYQQLPVIAFTARTMRGERQKCIEAGANDYLSKPVDVDKLLSLLRVWLY